jgi:hypothetical protein
MRRFGAKAGFLPSKNSLKSVSSLSPEKFTPLPSFPFLLQDCLAHRSEGFDPSLAAIFAFGLGTKKGATTFRECFFRHLYLSRPRFSAASP